MSELLNCPFCALSLNLITSPKRRSDDGPDYYLHLNVGCVLDGFRLAADADAIKDWNRRARASQVDGEVCLPQTEYMTAAGLQRWSESIRTTASNEAPADERCQPAAPGTLPDEPRFDNSLEKWVVGDSCYSDEVTAFRTYSGRLRQHAARLQGELAEAKRQHTEASKNAHMHYQNSVKWKQRAEAAERTVGELREELADQKVRLRRLVVKFLLPAYKADMSAVGKLCDEELDRSGALLGWLRDAHHEEQAALAGGERK